MGTQVIAGSRATSHRAYRAVGDDVLVRHEALLDHAVMKGHRVGLVAASLL
jgi:hypothetical protein